jgi:pilus assembly protein FimV
VAHRVGLSFVGRVIVAVLLALPCVVHAAGLGNLNVLSALGQRLNAEIEIVALQPGEDEGLTVRLAPADAFKRAGVDFNPVLSTVRFALERKGGKTLVRMTSTEPLNEPFLDVLLEIQWSSGRLVREYTFLLDPPGYAAAPSVAAPTAPVGAIAPVAAIPVPTPIAPATPPKPAAAQAQAQPAKAEAAAAQAKEAPAAQAAAAPKEEAAAAQPVAPVPVVEERPLAQPAEEAQARQPEATESKPSPAAEEKLAPTAAGVEQKPEQPKAEAGAAVAVEAQPEPKREQKPEAAPPAVAAAQVRPRAPETPRGFEVRKGDTLGEVAQWNLPQGVTMQQMLIALYRANPKAFLRKNINLVKAGAILSIPQDDDVAAIDRNEAQRLVSAHIAAFTDYRRSLSVAAAAAAGEETSGQRSSEGTIDTTPAKPAPAEPKDQVKLSKSEPGKPGSPQSRAAREDDAAARERALQEAQSRVSDLEKNVSDLKSLLELKNQQLAELEKKGKPAPSAPQVAKGPEAPKAAGAAGVAKAQPSEAPAAAKAGPAPTAPTTPPVTAKGPDAAKAATPAPAAGKPAGEAPKPAAPQVSAPVAKAPATEAPKAAPAATAKPAAKSTAKPEPGLFDELLDFDSPTTLGGLAAVVLVLAGYAFYAVRRRRRSTAGKGEAAAGAAGASSVFNPAAQGASGSPSVIMPSVGQASVGGMGGDEVDPIAEADVYMAYGRDAQAEEILREAIEKDPNRVNVHEKLLEIYANRRDTASFAQTVQKLQSLTGGSGPEWDKAMALGRSIDPNNSLYGGAPGAAPDISVGGPSPALDLDLGGGTTQRAAPDINLGAAEQPVAQAASSIDFDLGMQAPAATAAPSGAAESDFTPEGTLIIDSADAKAASSGLDFDLGTTETAKADDLGLNFELPSGLGASAAAAAGAAGAQAEHAGGGGGLEFDLKLGMGEEAQLSTAVVEAPMDLSSISLDLGAGGQSPAAGGDQKWQEAATKLDLAKAYEDMGDRDGARELLNEVLRDGDPAQQQQAQERLTALA